MADPAQTRDLVSRYLGARSERSIAGVTALLSEDVAYDPAGGERGIGREAVEAALVRHFRLFREALSDTVILVSEDGHRAAAEFTVRGTYQESAEGLPPADGQSFSVPGAAFFEVDEGRISRVTEYINQTHLVRQIAP